MIRNRDWWTVVAIFCIFVVTIVTLVIALCSVKGENEYLQKNIDRLYSYNFSRLQEELFFKQDLMVVAVEESAYICTSIFPYTKFAENEPLGEIVVKLGDMVEDNFQDARENIMKDEQLIEDMGRLALDLQNSDLAAKVLSGILTYT